MKQLIITAFRSDNVNDLELEENTLDFYDFGEDVSHTNKQSHIFYLKENILLK